MFYLMAVIALLLAGYVLPEVSRLRAEGYCRELWGMSHYGDGFDNDAYLWNRNKTLEPVEGIGASLFGENYRRKIVWVGVRNRLIEDPPTDEEASRLTEKLLTQTHGLDHLETLILTRGYPVTSRAIQSMGRLQSLRFVNLHSAEIDDRAVEAIAGMTNLEVLVLEASQVTAGNFAPLNRLEHLAWVQIIEDPDHEGGFTREAIDSLRQAAAGAYVTTQAGAQYRIENRAEIRRRRRIERLQEHDDEQPGDEQIAEEQGTQGGVEDVGQQ